MMKAHHSFAAVLTTLITILTLPWCLSAQSMWAPDGHDDERSIGFELFKPSLDESGISFTSSGLFLSVRWPLSERILLVGEAPFAYGSFEEVEEENGYGESDFAMGNPYLGIEIRGEETPVVGHLGVRVPLAPDDNVGTAIGWWSDFISRVDAFWTDMVPVTGGITYRTDYDAGFVVHVHGGGQVWFYTDGDETADVWGRYSAQVGYEAERFSLYGGFAGRILVTEEDLDFGERTLEELGLSARIGSGAVQPTFHFRLSLDDFWGEMLEYSFGVGLRVPLPNAR